MSAQFGIFIFIYNIFVIIYVVWLLFLLRDFKNKNKWLNEGSIEQYRRKMIWFNKYMALADAYLVMQKYLSSQVPSLHEMYEAGLTEEEQTIMIKIFEEGNEL